ncbi:827_t:CDS:2, partial [Scutellospora calospora]
EQYQKEFELLLSPSTFPHQQLEISDLLTVYFPNSENIPERHRALPKELEKLITTTLLKLENEDLKKKQEQLPSNENFEKLTKQNQA